MAKNNGAKDRVGQLVNHFVEAAATGASFSLDEMKILLNGKDVSHRNYVFNIMKNNPLFKLDYNLSKEALRHLTRARLLTLFQTGLVSSNPPPEDWEKSAAYGDAISYHDSSLNTLIGAQLVLFTGSILRLGTEFHHEHFLKRAERAELRGCFAMTELAHGSNVRGLETTAVFDKARDEFIINTPSESAQKYWIGGGAEWAQMATVFAQLYVDKVCYGVHAFLVPLRDDQNNILPGIRIKDCGHKMGLNGVDNGRFWFDHVRIPRTYLLDRFGSVNKDGGYSSIISNNDTRFAVTMGNLLTGRVSLSRGSTNVCKIALTTAIRYSAMRRQFGPPGQPETPILDYVSHHVRLMPLLATTYANEFISKKAANEFRRAQEAMDIDAIKDIHILVSGLKSLTTWHLAETLQTCREACGGQGYKSSNRIGILKADADIQLTYEGDNAVLLQQVSKDLMKGSPATPSPHRNDLELKSKIDHGYLLSGEAQLKVFQLREADLILRLKTEFEAAKASGMNSEEAMQACATIATDAGRAYIETKIFEEFLNKEAEAPAQLKGILSLLRSLYALNRFDSAPSFLREQYFTPEKQRAIHKAFVGLCTATKHHAIPLVDSFDIPAFLLGDIAGDYIQKNSFHSEDSP